MHKNLSNQGDRVNHFLNLQKIQIAPFIFTLFLLTHSHALFAQDTPELAQNNGEKLGLSTLIGYNFNGDNDWSNLTPDVFLGWKEYITGDSRSKFSLPLQMGPTISSPGNVRDTTNYLRALMLPGNASISAILYPTFRIKDIQLIAVFAAGLKVLSGLEDTTTVISQHNLRFGAGAEWSKHFALSFQYTLGWHNLTSSSEQNFQSVFNSNDTRVEYLLVSLQTYLPPVDTYLVFSWRKLYDFDSFVESDNDDRIITAGIRKTIDLLDAFPAK